MSYHYSGPASLKVGGACSFQKHIPYHPVIFFCKVGKGALCPKELQEVKLNAIFMTVEAGLRERSAAL